MGDTSCDFLDATYEDNDPVTTSRLPRPETPTPGGSRTLRRTTSCASIDTIRPLNKSRGVRRRIDEIAENLKNKNAKKKNKGALSQETPKSPGRDRSHSKKSQTTRPLKRQGKVTAPLQDSSHRSEEATVQSLADRLYSGIPSEQDIPSTSLDCESDSWEDEGPCENDVISTVILELKTLNATTDGPITFQPRRAPKPDIKDLQFKIESLEPDMTIWDGLRAPHHLYKCRLFLQCVAHSYDQVSMPDIRLLEMNCNTRPVAMTHYVRSPVLQSTYGGATPDWFNSTDGSPTAKLVGGIHIDRFWRTVLEDDGSWGWCRDAYVPLSPRLFDKVEYREFTLVSRAWIEDQYVEGESTFGMSMLLREVDMK